MSLKKYLSKKGEGPMEKEEAEHMNAEHHEVKEHEDSLDHELEPEHQLYEDEEPLKKIDKGRKGKGEGRSLSKWKAMKDCY